MTAMNYRRLGRSGLKVSELSFGSWVTYGNQLGGDLARECMSAAYDAGVNFSTTPRSMRTASRNDHGRGAEEVRLRRESYVVDEVLLGLNEGANQKNTLNRKYDGGDRRLACALGSTMSTSFPAIARSRHADRGDGARCTT